KQKRLSEQLFPITSPSIPIQTLHARRENYFASRGVDYHFREDYKAIFSRVHLSTGCNPQRKQLPGVLKSNREIGAKSSARRSGERTPLPGQHPFRNGQASVRPQFTASLILVLGNQTKKAVCFVRNSSGEINAGTKWKHIPQAIKLERRSISLHQRLDERAGRRIVNVDESITEIADPKFVVHQGES